MSHSSEVIFTLIQANHINPVILEK